MADALRILVIDDDKFDSINISRSISRSDIIAEVDNAFSSKEGFEKMRATKYNLIFLDYLMPDADGISILKKLRLLDIETPVIFITSQGDEKIASQAILEGASDYIPKTFLTPDGISHSIRNAIKLYEIQRLQKESELALKINADRLYRTQKLAKIGGWEINLKSDEVYFSDEFYNILEIEMQENPSLNLFRSCITNTEDLELFENNLNQIKGYGKEVQFGHNITGKKGSVKFINVYIKCFNDENNLPLRIVGSIQDISNQKQIEEELIEAKNIAEQSVKFKEQFLTNMSHEIRTPMNGIVGFTRILGETPLDENQKQSLDAIKTAGTNLMIIINDILDFSKIEADKMTFEKVNFSLFETINSVVELLSPNIKGDVKLQSTIDSDIVANLIGDPTRLSQILINLLGNALKFTEKGSVSITASQEKETKTHAAIRFTVSDTGIGIPQNKIVSIFESFNQASNETTRKYGGTGLGLTITKKLVELQGGTISVKSEISKGSEFSFLMQYKKGLKTIVKKAKEKEQLNFDFLKDKNILLVEDNKINQVLTKKVFEKWNKSIDIADDGIMAIKKIENNNYDIILMDIQMPLMDGNEVTKYIRTMMGSKSGIPIIALTAHATLEEEKRCFGIGMNDYLSKPYDFNVLLEKLHFNIHNSTDKKDNTSVEN